MKKREGKEKTCVGGEGIGESKTNRRLLRKIRTSKREEKGKCESSSQSYIS